MRTSLFQSRAALVALLLPSVVLAEASGSVTLTSEYRYRGIPQSNEEVTIQGGFDWFNASRVYVSTCASSVDLYPSGSSLSDASSVEFDVRAGYAGSLVNQLGYKYALSKKVLLGFPVGKSLGEVYADPALLGPQEYTDYSSSLSKEVAGVTLKATYIDTSIDSA